MELKKRVGQQSLSIWMIEIQGSAVTDGGALGNTTRRDGKLTKKNLSWRLFPSMAQDGRALSSSFLKEATTLSKAITTR